VFCCCCCCFLFLFCLGGVLFASGVATPYHWGWKLNVDARDSLLTLLSNMHLSITSATQEVVTNSSA
jgi:hypothetical protein